MSQLQKIQFYDIAGNCTDDHAWSPNTWKTRYALNYKGLSYRTIWLEYPDIERVCKEVGAKPSQEPKEGDSAPPYYSCPFIYDPNTNTAVSDSARIARYLDKTYPETPAVIPPGTDALHAAFESAFASAVIMPLLPILLPASHTYLNPRSQDHYRRNRERELGELFGGKLEDWSSPGPVREEQWRAIREGLSKVNAWMTVDGHEKPYVMGNQVCYADLFVAAWLVWVKRILGPQSSEWVELETWDGGRWGKLMKDMEQYEVVL
ncbi:hypothetical protein OBBRIDRAFT_796579 [Obba rivulosa]|uniref:GST N-terminal domain-containing protein n=1 Tax=Obba rivulosa TaxID=1052685 RepID=A0A8E2AS95_9APHY|nr:hypothetical protein OBBRIDRAFT_796579 [Obba rivulosa]